MSKPPRARVAAALAFGTATAAILISVRGMAAGVEARGEQAIVVAKPPSRYYCAVKTGALPTARLKIVSQRHWRAGEDAAWFKSRGLVRPGFAYLPEPSESPLPEGAPATLGGMKLLTAVPERDSVALLYGADGSGARHVAAMKKGGPISAWLDLAAFVAPPRFAPSEKEFVEGGAQWAVPVGDTVYVSTFHSTYAKSSYGLNGYLNAIDLRTGKLVWRSRPLVCNSRNFLVHDDVIIAGYGFTAERDFLYLLNRHTGAVLQKLPVNKAPEWIVEKGDRIYVRCYDSEDVLRLTRGKA